MRFNDLTGRKFDRLEVIERAPDHYYPNGRHDIAYKCRCDCGNIVTVLGIHLRSGHTKSCGCLRIDTSKESFTTHGMTNTRLYGIWKDMKQRCLNTNHPDFMLYGGRGIQICNDWINDFTVFWSWSIWSGYNDFLTLDRINVNGNYDPYNCRWVTQKDQCNNTRSNIFVTINEETRTLKQWTEKLDLNYGTVHSRVQRGYSPIEALTM